MDWESALVEAFHDGLRKQAKRYGPLQRRGDPSPEVLQRIGEDAAALATSNLSWYFALEPCVSARWLAHHFGRPEHDVVDDVESGRFVGLQGKYETLLPLWQFEDHTPEKHPLEAVTRVLEVFRTGLGEAFSPELVVLWAATPQPELKDQEPRIVFPTGAADEELTRSARNAVAGLAQ